MAALLTASSVAYVAYSDRALMAKTKAVERFVGGTNDAVQKALRVAIADIEAGRSASEALRAVHAALESKYARHADAKVAASCGALAFALLTRS
jgi:hypothetical protein